MCLFSYLTIIDLVRVATINENDDLCKSAFYNPRMKLHAGVGSNDGIGSTLNPIVFRVFV
jgi:hypothetical protein